MSATPEAAVGRAPGRTAVIGGGVAGLAAALALARAGSDVVVLEQAARVGGLVETEHDGHGVVLEHGPDGILIGEGEGAALVDELGLAVDRPRARRAMVLTERGLEPLPEGVFAFTPGAAWGLITGGLLDWRARVRLLAEPFVPRGGQDDESVAQFFTRRAGRAMAERIVTPLMRGVYGADASALGMASAMPRLLELERAHGSIARAMVARRSPTNRALVTLRGGMETLPQALAAALENRIRTGVRVVGLGRSRHGFRVDCGAAGALDVDGVVVATPAAAAARLVEHLAPDVAAALGTVRATDAEVVNLAWPRSALPPLDAAGFVTAPSARSPLRAATFASVKWPGRAPDDVVVVRCVLEPTGAPPAEMVRTTRTALRDLLDVQGEPLVTRVRSHRAALPIHGVGHRALVHRAQERALDVGPLAFAGNAWRGLGLPDCLASGLDAARALAAA